MGIKGWLFIGAGVLATVAILMGLKRKEDLNAEKVEKIMHEVDRTLNETDRSMDEIKKEQEEIEKAFREMGLDMEADAFVAAGEEIEERQRKAEALLRESLKSADEAVNQALKDGYSVLRKANEMLGDSEWNRKEAERIANRINEIQNEYPVKENFQHAVERKDFETLYGMFDRIYNPYVAPISRASAFGKAHGDGLISEELFQEAADKYGNLWFYVGD